MKKYIITLLALAIILTLSSCAGRSAVTWAYGCSALSRASINRTCKSYTKKRPETLDEMNALMGGKPQAQAKDSHGVYSWWERSEQYDDGGYLVANAACLSRNGKIILSCIGNPLKHNKQSPGVSYGDAALRDASTHPTLEKAAHQSMLACRKAEAAYKNKPLYFSPSGRLSYIPRDGEIFIGWQGENPIVDRTYAAPVQSQQPSKGLVILNAFADALVDVAVQNVAVSYQVPVSPTPTPSRNAEVLNDYVRRLQKKADDAREKTEEMRRRHIIEHSGFRAW